MLYAIARHINGNSLNDYIYTLDKQGKVLTFGNKNQAIAHLLLKGVKANSEVELKEFFGIRIVEYKENVA